MFVNKNMNTFYIAAVPVALLSATAAVITTAYLTNGKKRQLIYKQAYEKTKDNYLQVKTNNLMYNLNVYYYHNEHVKQESMQTSNNNPTLKKSLSRRCLNFCAEAAREAISTVAADFLAGTVADAIIPGSGVAAAGVRTTAECVLGEVFTETTNKAYDYTVNGAKQVAQATTNAATSILKTARNSIGLKPKVNRNAVSQGINSANELEREGKLSKIFGENFKTKRNSVRANSYDFDLSTNPFKVGLINAIQNFLLFFSIESIEKKATSYARTEFSKNTKDEAKHIYTQISRETQFKDVEYEQIATTIGVPILTNKLILK